MAERRIEYMPIDEIKFAEANPKSHDIATITKSVARFGYGEAPMLDERTGRLVAGHGRIETLRKMRDSQTPAPKGILVKDGKWLAPVQRGWASRTDAEADAYLLASNKLTQAGGWNDDGLVAMLKDLASKDALEGTGFTSSELDALLAEDWPKNADAIPDVPVDIWVNEGDMFQLGDHRIACGSSTDKAVVARLLGERKPTLMMTDPPYGVNYDPAWRNEALGTYTKRTGKVENDDQADWREAYALFDGPVAYVWHDGLFAGVVADGLRSSRFELRSQIIWAKPSLVLSRGHYHWQHEPCWYAVRTGATNRWFGDRKQTTLWSVDHAGAEDESEMHGTPKPVELYRRAYQNSSERGDFVYEPFCGSGTALIAAELTARKCLAIELSPQYVQLAIERWEKFTGKKHVKVDG